MRTGQTTETRMRRSYHEVLRQHPDLIPAAYDKWVREFALEKELPSSISFTAATWTKYASPADAREADRALALMDLSIGFFYPDDFSGADYQALFDDYRRNFDGIQPRNARPVIRAHAAYLGLLRGLNRPMEPFFDIRHKLMAEFSYRNRVARGEIETTFDRY